jgi:hypothetical protein
VPGGKGNIKPEDNVNGFQRNPQNINKNGRPRKLISHVIVEMEKNGIHETNTEQIKSVYLRLMNLTINEIQEKVEDDDEPALTRIVGKEILSGKGYDVIERMIDRAIGKPTQQTDVTTKGESVNRIDVTKEQIDKLIDKL